MQEKYVIDLDANHLLPIFAGCDLKQPYRFQPYVRIYITFEEYVKFVKDVVQRDLRVLFFPIEIYKKYLDENKIESLINTYYVDMSKAVTAELKMACIYGKDCTEICHDFVKSVSHVSREEIDGLFSHVEAEHVRKAAKYVNDDIAGCLKGTEMSDANRIAYRYAVLLRSLSMVKDPIKFSFK